MGFMKMGVSLMSLFFLTVMMSSFLALDFMFYVAVIIWFYGFFHANNLSGMPDEQFAQMQDVYLIPFAGNCNPACCSWCISTLENNVVCAVRTDSSCNLCYECRHQ